MRYKGGKSKLQLNSSSGPGQKNLGRAESKSSSHLVCNWMVQYIRVLVKFCNSWVGSKAVMPQLLCRQVASGKELEGAINSSLQFLSDY